MSCGLVPPPATRRQHRRQSRAQKTARSGLKGVREGGSPHGVCVGGVRQTALRVDNHNGSFTLGPTNRAGWRHFRFRHPAWGSCPAARGARRRRIRSGEAGAVWRQVLLPLNVNYSCRFGRLLVRRRTVRSAVAERDGFRREGLVGCYASPREDVRRERLGRSRDRFPGTGDAQESRRSATPGGPGIVFPPPWDGCATPIQAFSIFSPTTYFPPVRQAIPAWPQKSGAALDAFPPLFSGARTRGPIIEFARVDRMRAFFCRRGTADRNPTSPPTRRLSVLVLGGRRPQTGLRVLRRDLVDQRVWQSQTTRPLRF